MRQQIARQDLFPKIPEGRHRATGLAGSKQPPENGFRRLMPHPRNRVPGNYSSAGYPGMLGRARELPT